MQTLSTSLLKHLCLALLMALAGCATTSTLLPAKNEAISWQKRSLALTQIKSWDIQGVISIRTANAGETANIHWQQNDQNYTLLLFGPLGASPYRLDGTKHKVTLTNPEGKQFSALSPEQLLAQQTGWLLPISSLYYWIRGLPVPGVAADKHLDAYHHLTELRQQGWQIQFLGYVWANKLDLPKKIYLINPQLQVKIIITQWQI
jgi:outer membrane lipoprotein LolB